MHTICNVWGGPGLDVGAAGVDLMETGNNLVRFLLSGQLFKFILDAWPFLFWITLGLGFGKIYVDIFLLGQNVHFRVNLFEPIQINASEIIV